MTSLWPAALKLMVLFARYLPTRAEPHLGHSLEHPHHLRRQDPPPGLILNPVHPSAVAGAEGRPGGNHVSPGDYIMHGLSNTMNLVDQEYGLRDSESFYWGIDGNPIANLTAYAEGEAVRVLSLERFDDVLENAECDQSSVRLTFVKEVQFDAVQTAWQWVNDAEENYIVLITESAQCNIADGDSTIRQPWHVKNVAFDDNTNVVTLSAEPKKWAEAFSSWRLRIRSGGILPPPPIEKRMRLSGKDQISLNHNFSGTNMAISATDSHGNSGTASINCTLCETYGYLDFDIDIVPWVLPPHLEGYAEVTADAVGTVFQVKTTVTGYGSLYRKTVELFDIELPVGRIGIPDILDLAPHLKFSVEGKIGAPAEMSFESGVVLNITDDSTYKLNVETWNATSHGWVPSITPSMAPDIDGALSVQASIGGLLQLDYQAEVLGIKGSIGVELAAPTLTFKASTFADESACGVPEADYGMNFEVDLGMSFNAYEELEGVLVPDIKEVQTIWAVSTQLYDLCETIGAADYTPLSSAPAAGPTGAGPTGTGPTGVVGFQNGTWNAPYPTAYSGKAVRG